jgi:DNA-binding response OmpR family regulator
MKKILIVDDEPSVVRLMSKRLKDNGYETIGTHYGHDAIKIAKEKIPDLILLDWDLPPGGGISVFKILKVTLLTTRIPIIFITGSGEKVKKRILELGADGYFQKPFNFVELKEKIEELIGE